MPIFSVTREQHRSMFATIQPDTPLVTPRPHGGVKVADPKSLQSCKIANRLYLLFQRYTFCSILCFLDVIWGETSAINRQIISTKQLHEIRGFHGRFVQDSYFYDATHCVAGLAFPDRSKELTAFIFRDWDVQVILGRLSPWRWRNKLRCPSNTWASQPLKTKEQRSFQRLRNSNPATQRHIPDASSHRSVTAVHFENRSTNTNIVGWWGCRAYWCYGRWYVVTTGL